MSSLNCLSIRQAVEKIMEKVIDEAVITSCGYISREVYRVKDRPRNFYIQGSMGMALPLGLGLAYSRPDLNIIVISGEGAVLMSLGSSVLQQYLKLTNIQHIILINNCYASTGGQPNCWQSLNMGMHNTEALYVDKESDAPRIPMTCIEIKERFENAIKRNVPRR